jgi:hypothetical protein
VIHLALLAALSAAPNPGWYEFPAFPDQRACEEIAIKVAPRLAIARKHGVTLEEIDAMHWAPNVPAWYRALFDHWAASLYQADDEQTWFVSVVLRDCRGVT